MKEARGGEAGERRRIAEQNRAEDKAGEGEVQ